MQQLPREMMTPKLMIVEEEGFVVLVVSGILKSGLIFINFQTYNLGYVDNLSFLYAIRE
jgi:hypothetical protein